LELHAADGSAGPFVGANTCQDVSSALADRRRRRGRPHRPLIAGQVAALAAGAAMLAGALWFDTPLRVAVVCFLVLMVATGLIIANSGALAAAEVPDHPGTGSAVLGFVHWVVAGITAPIAGLGGQDTAVPLAVLMVSGACLSMIGLLVLAQPG
jgi:MFS transporter, DHA1 family, multidrug resistance protein